jgi:hypothetical protein
MKIAANIVGGLLGFIFVVLPILMLSGIIKAPPPDPSTSAGQFMAATMPTGFMTYVLTFEIIGGVLVAIPKLRNFGLLVLGPIIVNILAYHILIMKGEGLAGPPLVVAGFGAFLLFAARRQFAGLKN